MDTERTAQEMQQELKSVKLGLLRIANSTATHGKTVTDAGREIPLPAYGRKLAGRLESLKLDLEHTGVMTDAVLRCKVGESFRVPAMQLQMIKEGIHKLADATENDKASIIAGKGKVLTTFQYASDLVNKITDLEKSLQTEQDNIRNKIKPVTGGKAVGFGPYHSVQ